MPSWSGLPTHCGRRQSKMSESLTTKPGSTPVLEIFPVTARVCEVGRDGTASQVKLDVGRGQIITISGDTWAQGLRGITAAQIAQAFRAMLTRTDAWPPTLPEFRAACFAMPTLVEIRAEIAGDFSALSPFGYATSRRMDLYAYRRADMKAADRMLRDAYEEVREAVIRGEELPPVPVRIEQKAEPAVTKANPDHVKHCLEQMRAGLGGRS